MAKLHNTEFSEITKVQNWNCKNYKLQNKNSKTYTLQNWNCPNYAITNRSYPPTKVHKAIPHSGFLFIVYAFKMPLHCHFLLQDCDTGMVGKLNDCTKTRKHVMSSLKHNWIIMEWYLIDFRHFRDVNSGQMEVTGLKKILLFC